MTKRTTPTSQHDDRSVTISFTETIEYALELDFADMAKKLGVSKKKLAEIIDDGEVYEPSDAAKNRLRREADVQSEEFTVDDVFG